MQPAERPQRVVCFACILYDPKGCNHRTLQGGYSAIWPYYKQLLITQNVLSMLQEHSAVVLQGAQTLQIFWQTLQKVMQEPPRCSNGHQMAP